MGSKSDKFFNAALGVAEFVVGSMADQASSYSKDSRFTDEIRDQYSTMSNSYGNIKDSIHDYRYGTSYEDDDEDDW